MPQPKGRYVSYEEASRVAQQAGCRSRDQYWRWHVKSAHAGIPKMPQRVYKEWSSWNDFLGTSNQFIPGRFRDKKRTDYRSFWEAARYVHKLKLRTAKEWTIHTNENEIPNDIPKRPEYYYKKTNEWMGWPSFLGTDVTKVVEAQQQDLAVLAFVVSAGQQPNIVTMLLEKEGVAVLRESQQQNGFRIYRVYEYERELMTQVQHILDSCSTPYYGDANTRLVPNLNQLIFELDSILKFVKTP
jgi:hypothetical protein